jgi:hypothetical protein
MVDLLGPGGRLVFYGATSGYTLTFLGKAGAAPAAEMFRRADLRPREGVLVYWGFEDGADDDPVAAGATAAALAAGARVVVACRLDRQAARVKAAHAVQGVVSLESLARAGRFSWPDAMPDYDLDLDGYRAYQDTTLKPFGLAVGRLLAAADNPRGNPDLVVERAGQDTLGISTFLARPFTGTCGVRGVDRGPALLLLRAQRVDAREADPVSRLRGARLPSLQRASGGRGGAAPRRGRASAAGARGARLGGARRLPSAHP